MEKPKYQNPLINKYAGGFTERAAQTDVDFLKDTGFSPTTIIRLQKLMEWHQLGAKQLLIALVEKQLGKE
jgi:hypothetical protein